MADKHRLKNRGEKNMKIDTWSITLPDGTLIVDEIEFGYALSTSGLSLVPQRNRRTVTSPEGEETTVAVPENYEQNRNDLLAINAEWKRAEEKFSLHLSKREERYVLYKAWLQEHLDGNVLSSLLFSFSK